MGFISEGIVTDATDAETATGVGEGIGISTDLQEEILDRFRRAFW